MKPLQYDIASSDILTVPKMRGSRIILLDIDVDVNVVLGTQESAFKVALPCPCINYPLGLHMATIPANFSSLGHVLWIQWYPPRAWVARMRANDTLRLPVRKKFIEVDSECQEGVFWAIQLSINQHTDCGMLRTYGIMRFID